MIQLTLLAIGRTSILLACATVLCAGPAHAGGLPTVLLLPADSAVNYNDAKARIDATGLVGQVDILLSTTATPTLVQLMAYDAVLTWSNQTYQSSVALGDVLADYVDAGGGVVVSTFANSTATTGRFLGGRWLMGYEVIVTQGGNQTGAASLGTVHVPAHPVMNNVTTFVGGSSAFRPVQTNLTAGSTLVASWTDGKVLVAQGSQPNRVDLGFVPYSSLASGVSWTATTDGGLLMANALVHVSGGGPSNVFCSGDGTATACPCGNAGAPGNGCASSVNAAGAHVASSGQASIANDSLVLSGSMMPDSSALYFQGTSQVAAGQGAPFGDGLRCVGGTIVRLKTVTNSAGASQYPQPGDPSVSVRGMVLVPGVRTYQVWYRNAAAFCTPSTFNLSNGIEVTWS